VLPRPGLFRAALAAAQAARPVAPVIPARVQLGRRLRAMLDLAPSKRLPRARPPARVNPVEGERRARVALLAGCAQQVLAPSINAATIRLLNRLGIEVVVPPGSGCCGALAHHMGRRAPAHASAWANIEAWNREAEEGGLDAVIINTSGCRTTVKDYGFMFRSESRLRGRAERVAALAVDISEFLVRVGYAPRREPPGLTVAYHAACSLQHGQRVTAEPKSLLRTAGFTVVEPAESHICCGSAGTYNLLQPELAGRLRERKLGNLRATRPDLIAAGNIGCMTQLAGGGLPVVHTVELLDWMAGGPTPEALAERLERAA
jgi:glycolate oxidase iron-sulfur subunit